ncbi:hypothetical protein Baya_5641 [Bagarius yarrelli]|uniref:Uncharacterized protein n=1 Tax=Bagarius yarrelli TaxID=175774 RepID=A0A556TW85_BAGYA|nr:hypothetical protein Baya_5641 [Bagarius yarrelli]
MECPTTLAVSLLDPKGQVRCLVQLSNCVWVHDVIHIVQRASQRKRGHESRDLFRQNPVWRNLSADESFRSDGNLSTLLWRIVEKRLAVREE